MSPAMHDSTNMKNRITLSQSGIARINKITNEILKKGDIMTLVE